MPIGCAAKEVKASLEVDIQPIARVNIGRKRLYNVTSNNIDQQGEKGDTGYPDSQSVSATRGLNMGWINPCDSAQGRVQIAGNHFNEQ